MSSYKFDMPENGDLNGHGGKSSGVAECRISVVSGFILTVLFVVLAVLVGLIVHLTGSAPEVVCDCQYPNNEGNNLPIVQVTTQAPITDPDLTTTAQTTEPPEITTSHTPDVTTETPSASPTNYRLPTSLIPYHYDLRIRTTFEGSVSDFSFNGSVRIYFTCKEATTNITLHMKMMNITADPQVEGQDGGTAPQYSRHEYSEVQEFLIVYVNSEFEPETNYSVLLHFGALLRQDLHGLYYSDYVTEDNATVHTAFTQLQATEARSMWPCFDEPALKATFSITLESKADDGKFTLANTQLINEYNEGGYTIYEFDRTVVMPTYLVAVAYCDFKNISRYTNRSNTLVSTYTRPEYINQSHLALDIAIDTQEALENYLNIDFDMPKLDHIAVPDYAYGGMENWGLITYNEPYMLYEANVTTTSIFAFLVEVVTHEVAHMWFGNLVTMDWWTETWLNEGFATYFSYFALDMVRPEWKIMDLFLYQFTQIVMSQDSYTSAAPLVHPDVNSPAEIDGRFDGIIYEKGASIIRMISFAFGEDVLQSALQTYLRNHSYSTVVTDDLWWHLSEACRNKSSSDSTDCDVKTLMDPWIYLNNLPVVNVTRDGDKISLTQDHFYLFNDSSQFAGEHLWNIPFTFTTSSEMNFNPTRADVHWCKDKTCSDIPGTVAEGDWILANINAYGYYRTNYDDTNWRNLQTQLTSDHEVLPILNRAQLINDAWMLSRRGLVSLTTALDIMLYLKNETEVLPWLPADDALYFIESIIRQDYALYFFERFVVGLINQHFRSLKLDLGDTRLLLERRFDHVIFERACRHYMQECIDQSMEMYQKWKINDSLIPSDIKDVVLCTVVREGDSQEWEYLLTKYHSASVMERDLYLKALTCSKRNSLLNRLMNYLLDPMVVKDSDVSWALVYLSDNTVALDTAWNFVREHWQKIVLDRHQTLTQQTRIIRAITRGMYSEYDQAQVQDWKDNIHPINNTVPWGFNSALSRIQSNREWHTINYKSLETWLSEHV